MQCVVSSHLASMLANHLDGFERALIIGDPETIHAMGAANIKKLKEALRASLLCLPSKPEASIKSAESIAHTLKGSPSAIAIGSGTINDLVKYAAFTANMPYAVIATAPSMNGYTSSTASLKIDGCKRSLPAAAPAKVLADSDVLARAPMRLIRAGVGDTLCRSTVEADWRLAHVMGKAEWDESIMLPVREAETALRAEIEGIKERTPEAIQALWEALLAGGNAMHTHGSSMPASQGEHMIAHCMEEAMPEVKPLHGEAISVTTLTMAKLQQRLLLHPSLKEHAQWIAQHSIAVDVLEQALKVAGCPTTPKDVGWVGEIYARIANEAWKTRDRYGFLAFAAECSAPVC